MTNQSEKQEWREFEKLAARIEAAVAPMGAVIRCPDHLPDLVSGSSREVDASIRYTIGTVPILITIECRRRSEVQDDTWIEQLATKRNKIGAAKTIAVSFSGFTEPAKKTAKLYGIELRDLREARADEIADSIRQLKLIKKIRRIKIQRVHVKIAATGETVNLKTDKGYWTLVRAHDKGNISPFVLFDHFFRPQLAEVAEKELSTAISFEWTAIFPPGSIHARIDTGVAPAASITFELEICEESSSIDAKNPRCFVYGSGEGLLLHITEFELEIGPALIILAIHSNRSIQSEVPQNSRDFYWRSERTDIVDAICRYMKISTGR